MLAYHACPSFVRVTSIRTKTPDVAGPIDRVHIATPFGVVVVEGQPLVVELKCHSLVKTAPPGFPLVQLSWPVSVTLLLLVGVLLLTEAEW